MSDEDVRPKSGPLTLLEVSHTWLELSNLMIPRRSDCRDNEEGEFGVERRGIDCEAVEGGHGRD